MVGKQSNMPRIPNAFKFRVADQTVLDTSVFLHLYSPIYLAQLQKEDFTAPKLIVLLGSPGSGKSSLLRLFETSTLIALTKNQGQKVENTLLTTLHDLGVLEGGRPVAFGIYVHCDSSLRDIENLEVAGANDKLLNTLLDVRIIGGYIRSLELLTDEFTYFDDLHSLELPPLPPEDLPPSIFGEARTIGTLKLACQQVERDFAKFLNSFPGEELPSSIKTHSKVFSIPYLSHLKKAVPQLAAFLPIVMLDDVHELYEKQREQVNAEMLKRSSIPRWVAVRKHVYELESLISMEGATEQRDFREISLDSASTALFRRFVNNVANRRLNMSSDLQPYNVTDFSDQLDDDVIAVPVRKISKDLDDLLRRIREIDQIDPILDDYSQLDHANAEVGIANLVSLEARLILLERQKNKPQQSLFGMPTIPDNQVDGKVQEAARLFAAKRFKLPYYYSFDTLAECATGNVEQFLSVASPFAEKMILRAELSQNIRISPQDQRKLLRKSAENYFDLIDWQFDRGYAIKQLVDNLGLFFNAVTFRPNAPIAPGVNGFGFEREQLRQFLARAATDAEVAAFREVLTRAVAGNVLFARETKQGQAGTERIVFYVNRILCVKYDLPLSKGGWQYIKPELLIEMMKRPVAAREWGKRWVEPLLGEPDS